MQGADRLAEREDERVSELLEESLTADGIAVHTGAQAERVQRDGDARIVTLDADLSHDPSDIPRLLAMLDSGADVAIGSRFAPGGEGCAKDSSNVRHAAARVGKRQSGRQEAVKHAPGLRV